MDAVLMPKIDNQTILVRPTVLRSIGDAFRIMRPSKKSLEICASFGLLFKPCFVEDTRASQKYTLSPEFVIKSDVFGSTIKSSLMSRIEELVNITNTGLEDRASALSHTVRSFAIQMVCSFNDEELTGWTLFPDVNGSLRMDYKTIAVTSSISVGDDGFSWFIKTSNNFEMKDCSELKLQEIQRCMDKVQEEENSNHESFGRR